MWILEGRTSLAEGKVTAKALRHKYSGVFRNSRGAWGKQSELGGMC